MLPNAEWYEILWTAMGVLWAAMCAWGTWTAGRDWRYVVTHPDPDPAQQTRLRALASGYLRYESSSCFGGLLITFLGIRTLLLPPNPASPDGWSAAAGIAVICYAAIKTVVSVQNRLARRHFDRSWEAAHDH